MSSIFQKFRYLIPKERTASGHQQIHEGGRDWENMYRDRWSFDKRVRSTHGVKGLSHESNLTYAQPLFFIA